MTLHEMHRIKLWQDANRHLRPVECGLWTAALTLWVLGWVGWLPVLVLDDTWAMPLCVAGTCAPQTYLRWRSRAHRERRVRCDWLGD
jgi:hypothetical protein